MFFKHTHHTLYLVAHGVIAVTHGADGARVTARFEHLDDSADDPRPDGLPIPVADSATESLQHDFDQWVRDRSDDIFTLVVDHVDEQQSIEEIPRLGSRDRAALIAKRIRQRFRDSEFHTHRRGAATNKGGKKAIQVSITALKSSVNIKPWLDVLLNRKVRIRSMTSPTLLASSLIARIAPGQTGLLVSRTPAGLRQTLLVDGDVRFSRLAGLKAFDASQILAEVRRSLQYLLMTQRLKRLEIQDSGLTIWLVDEAIDNLPGVPASVDLDASTKASIRLLSVESAGLACVEPSEGLSIWTQAAQTLGKRRDYATARICRFEKIAQWRRGFWTAGGLTCVIGGVLAAMGGHVIDPPHRQIESVQREIIKLAPRLQSLRELRDAFPVAPNDLASAPKIAALLRFNKPDSNQIAGQLASAFSASHGLHIKEITFQPSKPADLTLMSGLEDESGALQPSLLESDLRISLSGLTDKTLNRTQANAQIQALAERMSALCNCSADTVKLPYDPSPLTGLTGRVEDGNSGDEETAGKFAIVWLMSRGANLQNQAMQQDAGTAPLNTPIDPTALNMESLR